MYLASRTAWLVLALLLQGCSYFEGEETADRPTESGFGVGQHVSNEMADPTPAKTPEPGSL